MKDLGLQALLVEPCDMVRQVLLLALRAWGMSICAVKTEDEAMSHLRLRSVPLTSASDNTDRSLCSFMHQCISGGYCILLQAISSKVHACTCMREKCFGMSCDVLRQ